MEGGTYQISTDLIDISYFMAMVWKVGNRGVAVMAAAMLAIGVAVGAAIGPAPAPSQADPTLPLLLASLAKGAAARAAQARAAAAQSAAATAEATPARKRHRRKRRHAQVEEAATATSTAPASESETTTPTSTTPTSKPKTSSLPPVTHVWLIELADTSFASAIAQPTAAPYIDTQAIPAGTLLSGWSALDGGAFASEAALVAGSSPLADLRSVLDTIVQPPCGEGAAGASCATEAGALTAADEFLKATVPTITSTAAFRENGADRGHVRVGRARRPRRACPRARRRRR